MSESWSQSSVHSVARKRFEHFVRHQAGSLYTLFRRCLGNAETARDLLQDTFVDAWKNLSRYDSSRPFRPWVFRIGHNRLRNHLRRQRLEGHAVNTVAQVTRSVELAPPSMALERERNEQLEKALLELPPRQRVVVLLRYQEGLPCQEIGAILGMTVNAVSIQLHRARQSLKKHLGSNLVGDGR